MTEEKIILGVAFGFLAIALIIGASVIIQSGVKQIKKAINKHFGSISDAMQKRKDNLLDSCGLPKVPDDACPPMPKRKPPKSYKGPEKPVGVSPHIIDSGQSYGDTYYGRLLAKLVNDISETLGKTADIVYTGFAFGEVGECNAVRTVATEPLARLLETKMKAIARKYDLAFHASLTFSTPMYISFCLKGGLK